MMEQVNPFERSITKEELNSSIHNSKNPLERSRPNGYLDESEDDGSSTEKIYQEHDPFQENLQADDHIGLENYFDLLQSIQPIDFKKNSRFRSKKVQKKDLSSSLLSRTFSKKWVFEIDENEQIDYHYNNGGSLMTLILTNAKDQIQNIQVFEKIKNKKIQPTWAKVIELEDPYASERESILVKAICSQDKKSILAFSKNGDVDIHILGKWWSVHTDITRDKHQPNLETELILWDEQKMMIIVKPHENEPILYMVRETKDRETKKRVIYTQKQTYTQAFRETTGNEHSFNPDALNTNLKDKLARPHIISKRFNDNADYLVILQPVLTQRNTSNGINGDVCWDLNLHFYKICSTPHESQKIPEFALMDSVKTILDKTKTRNFDDDDHQYHEERSIPFSSNLVAMEKNRFVISINRIFSSLGAPEENFYHVAQIVEFEFLNGIQFLGTNFHFTKIPKPDEPEDPKRREKTYVCCSEDESLLYTLTQKMSPFIHIFRCSLPYGSVEPDKVFIKTEQKEILINNQSKKVGEIPFIMQDCEVFCNSNGIFTWGEIKTANLVYYKDLKDADLTRGFLKRQYESDKKIKALKIFRDPTVFLENEIDPELDDVIKVISTQAFRFGDRDLAMIQYLDEIKNSLDLKIIDLGDKQANYDDQDPDFAFFSHKLGEDTTDSQIFQNLNSELESLKIHYSEDLDWLAISGLLEKSNDKPSKVGTLEWDFSKLVVIRVKGASGLTSKAKNQDLNDALKFGPPCVLTYKGSNQELKFCFQYKNPIFLVSNVSSNPSQIFLYEIFEKKLSSTQRTNIGKPLQVFNISNEFSQVLRSRVKFDISKRGDFVVIRRYLKASRDESSALDSERQDEKIEILELWQKKNPTQPAANRNKVMDSDFGHQAGYSERYLKAQAFSYRALSENGEELNLGIIQGTYFVFISNVLNKVVRSREGQICLTPVQVDDRFFNIEEVKICSENEYLFIKMRTEGEGFYNYSIWRVNDEDSISLYENIISTEFDLCADPALTNLLRYSVILIPVRSSSTSGEKDPKNSVVVKKLRIREPNNFFACLHKAYCKMLIIKDNDRMNHKDDQNPLKGDKIMVVLCGILGSKYVPTSCLEPVMGAGGDQDLITIPSPSQEVNNLYINFLIHENYNLPYICVVTEEHECLRQVLALVGYHPFFYKEGFDPFIAALQLNCFMSIKVFVDYFQKPENQHLIPALYDRKVFKLAMLTANPAIHNLLLSKIFINPEKMKKRGKIEFQLCDVLRCPTIDRLPLKSKNYLFTIDCDTIEIDGFTWQAIFQRLANETTAEAHKKKEFPVKNSISRIKFSSYIRSESCYDIIQISRKLHDKDLEGTFKPLVTHIWRSNRWRWILFFFIFELFCIVTNICYFLLFPKQIWAFLITFSLSLLLSILEFLKFFLNDSGRHFTLQGLLGVSIYPATIFASSMIFYRGRNQIPELNEFFDFLVSLLILILGVRIFSLLAIFDDFRQLNVMVIQVFSHLRTFGLICAIFVFIFTLAGINLSKRHSEFPYQPYELSGFLFFRNELNLYYNYLFDEWGGAEATNKLDGYHFLLYIISSIVFAFVLSNMVIAMVLETYENFSLKRELIDLRLLCRILSEYSRIILVFQKSEKRERDLRHLCVFSCDQSNGDQKTHREEGREELAKNSTLLKIGEEGGDGLREKPPGLQKIVLQNQIMLRKLFTRSAKIQSSLDFLASKQK